MGSWRRTQTLGSGGVTPPVQLTPHPCLRFLVRSWKGLLTVVSSGVQDLRLGVALLGGDLDTFYWLLVPHFHHL